MKAAIPAIHDINYSSSVLVRFDSQVKEFGLIETGGVLLGYVNNGIIYITHASDPGPKAIHELGYFQADANYIDMYIDMECANSAGKLRYIGEWHTHPEVQPSPSDKDVLSISEIAESSEDFVLMIIIGAARYSADNFEKQHISILKYKGDRRLYRL